MERPGTLVTNMDAHLHVPDGVSEEGTAATCIGHIRHLNEKGHRFGRDCYLEFGTDVLGMASLLEAGSVTMEQPASSAP